MMFTLSAGNNCIVFNFLPVTQLKATYEDEDVELIKTNFHFILLIYYNNVFLQIIIFWPRPIDRLLFNFK